MINQDSTLHHFSQVKVKKPSDIILDQIRELIKNGTLKPGDKLPSERLLSEKFEVSRGQVREAIKRLEFYGILKTEPNKGTVVASIGVKALEGLISNILHIDRTDFNSLFETRMILETAVAKIAASTAKDDYIALVRKSFEAFRIGVEQGRRPLEEDHIFHLKIAESTGNSILSSFIGLITPDVINMNKDTKENYKESSKNTLTEHAKILEALEEHNPNKAAKAMEDHMYQSYRRRFGKEYGTK